MSLLMDRRDFMKTVGIGTAASMMPKFAIARPLGIDKKWDGISNPHPELKKIGNKFSFAINADPQVGYYEHDTGVYLHCNNNISNTVKQLNARKPNIDFLVYLGDVVNVPDERSFDNFYKRNSDFNGLTVVNHGNHDTSPPYTRFRDYEEKINGVRSVYYSFDVGKWHFITIPANIEFGNYDNLEVKEPMLKWFKEDLKKNKDRPTIVFVHIHIMPQGLTQLEWYTHTPGLKKELINAMAEHGNVKYCLNGHVHNGIKVALKTAWTYKGINFITMPSGTPPRPFGEEFPKFAEGLEKGGYYTIVDIDNEEIKFTSRNVYSEGEFVYPEKFKEFSKDIEPRMMSKLIDLPAKPKLENGSFANGLAGWSIPYRYNCDGPETGFQNEWRMKHKKDGRYSGYVYTKPLGKHWLQDEYNEFYQIVEAPGDAPLFKGSYFLEEAFEKGGGYYRIIAVSGNEGKDNGNYEFIMEFDFVKSEHEYEYDYYPRAMGYTISGEVSSWLYFQRSAKRKKGFFIDVPLESGKWHNIQANIAQIYDKATGKPGAYKKLNISRFIIAAGTVCIKDVEKGAGAFFDKIELKTAEAEEKSAIDGSKLIIDDSIFETVAGQKLQDSIDNR
ncbi:metallophosphoesterase [Sedimentisphaera salicampi]|uniref:metallophosphoesterase n=1 Tax=Sedimentisphaera salicampi TaxID=1941349 RepID=UPI000B9CFB31|nr:metallophosphoesterase [Sedimentisphaera salicampi]OXU14907.1 cyclic 3',5'-adenosine monophosphate phosphodiesterase [Sedimentisphaera salicampi]